MIDETLLEAEEKMERAVEVAKGDFAGIRTGRAHPGMFQKILVDYYGAPTPLQQLAHHHHRALRQGRHEQHREGHPGLRPRREPLQ